MSRSRKMLNMLKEVREESGIFLSFSQPAVKVAKTLISDVNVNDNTCKQPTSPLPHGAEEISQELADVWEEIMQEDCSPKKITCSSSTPIVMSDKCADNSNNNSIEKLPQENIPQEITCDSSIQVATNQPSPDDVYSNQPSLLPLEVPSSFENSPQIELEGLEISQRSNLVPSELYEPTPIPSPTNVHSVCDSIFCPCHEGNYSVTSVQSFSTTNSPATSHLSLPTVTRRTSKKRQKRVKEWADIKRKCLKNLGKKYVTKKGKSIDEKTMGASCKCRYTCPNKITYQQRLECFTKFWQLGDRAKQWNFIVKYTDKTKKKRCLNQDAPNNRKYTYKYYLPLITDYSESHCEKTEVCQTMFLNTLSVSTRIVKTAWMKYDGSAIIEEDQRGRHDNHKIVIDGAMKQSVCDHVNSFDPVESHYLRKDSEKLYLPGHLSIAKMFKLYLEWFDAEKYSSKATKERQYRDIVNCNFNLVFHIPKKDQCDDCHVFRMKKIPTDEEKEAFQQHQNNKKVARQLKSQDKKDAEESNGKIVTSVFDFEKVLQCPLGEISIFYYKRKLSVFNFTVYDMGKKKAVCYMWDESVAKRGANEVSSCLLDFIQTNVEQGANEFRFWSDNATGQNRNRFVFALYVYAAKKFNIRITHRFMQKGHTQNEGDSVHSVIERASRAKIIYTPHEWRLLAKWAKNDGEPYVIRNISQNDVFDFKSLVNDKVWLKDIRGMKINWSNIREVHADGSDSNKLFFKYDQTQPEFNILVIGGNTRNSVQSELKHAYSEPIKISAFKYKDLMDMCRLEVIPKEYHPYFNSLPHD
ncbi:uncharacterized protein LOC128669186 [Plodia interpunctella]|uniref:uncharacterized protein LOC128669186 n=1 Tax=Plodia interpunctella TaxID=58824 RepID=UPI0023682546|nr:uncharacterized protein LOC128669186 [Plodia interpunctella]